jgi:hypothetical protein
MKHFLTITFILISFLTFAQKPIPYWGKLSAEERNLKVVSYDSTASAVVLGHWGEMSVENSNISIQYVKRIKILDKRGIDYGNIVIPYYAKNDLEFIKDFEGQIILPNGTAKMIDKKSIFDEKVNEYYRLKKVVFPNVEVGSVIEYKYTLISKNYFSLESWNFQGEIPTLYSDLKAVFSSKYVGYSYGLRGSRLYKKYQEAPKSEYLQWSLENLPALIEEPFVANNRDYSERIDFQLLEYLNSSNAIIKVATTWEKVCEQMSDVFQPYLNKKGVAKDILPMIITPNDTPKDKIQKIYNYVVANYSWNEIYGISTKISLNSLVENKKGMATEINLLLTLLLKEAGFEAAPAMYSTRKNGKAVVDFPIVDNFNMVGCGLKFENKFYLLNAIDGTRPYTLPALQDLNMQCFWITGFRKGEWMAIEPPRSSKQVVSTSIDLASKDPSMTLNISYDGYEAMILRKSFLKLGESEFKNTFKQIQVSEWELKDLSIENINEIDKMVVVKMSFKPESDILSNDILYLKPIILKYFSKNPYTGNIRRLPIEVDYPTLYRYVLNLKLPAGYTIESSPKNEGIKLPNDTANFTYTSNLNDDGTYQLVTGFQLRTSYFQTEYFPYLKSIYDTSLAKWEEMIVLKKK